jgi:Transcriptional Coactivator p15 (PC4)
MNRRIAIISDPIVISRFWKNRAHDAIEVSLKSFEGNNLCDVRMYVMRGGVLLPSTKGVSVVIPRLPDLAAAINKALAKAKELGLLDDQGEASA